MSTLHSAFYVPAWSVETNGVWYLVSDHLTPLDQLVWNGLFIAVSSVGGYESRRVRYANGYLLGI